MELAIGGFALSVVIVGAVQIGKTVGLSGRWAPLTAALLGILGGIAVAMSDPAMLTLDGVVAGFMSGLSAVGLYSGTKHTTRNGNPPELPPENYPD